MLLRPTNRSNCEKSKTQIARAAEGGDGEGGDMKKKRNAVRDGGGGGYFCNNRAWSLRLVGSRLISLRRHVLAYRCTALADDLVVLYLSRLVSVHILEQVFRVGWSRYWYQCMESFICSSMGVLEKSTHQQQPRLKCKSASLSKPRRR